MATPHWHPASSPPWLPLSRLSGSLTKPSHRDREGFATTTRRKVNQGLPARPQLPPVQALPCPPHKASVRAGSHVLVTPPRAGTGSAQPHMLILSPLHHKLQGRDQLSFMGVSTQHITPKQTERHTSNNRQAARCVGTPDALIDPQGSQQPGALLPRPRWPAGPLAGTGAVLTPPHFHNTEGMFNRVNVKCFFTTCLVVFTHCKPETPGKHLSVSSQFVSVRTTVFPRSL